MKRSVSQTQCFITVVCSSLNIYPVLAARKDSLVLCIIILPAWIHHRSVM